MRILPTTALLVLTALPAAAAPPLQPGFYEISLQLILPRTQAQLPVRQLHVCLANKDIIFGDAYALSETGRLCKVSRFQHDARTVRYAFVCDTAGRARMVGQAQGTHHPAGYDILMTGRFIPAMEGMSEFTQKTSAKRLGACE